MPARTYATAEDLERMPKPLQGGGYELIEGELVYVSPVNVKHFRTVTRLFLVLRDFVNERRLGELVMDVWFQFAPGVILAPDISLISREDAPRVDPEHVLKFIPKFVVEVLSPGNTAIEMTRKLRWYLESGVQTVWIIDPDRREVDVHKDRSIKTLRSGDTLTEPDILPGFSMPVLKLFED